jgi:hypothetical protein
MKKLLHIPLALLTLTLLGETSHAQGTFRYTVTFDGFPYMAPTSEFLIDYYYEQGVVFTPIRTGQFGRSGGQPALLGFPRNGTAYLFAMLGDSLAVSSLNGSRFGLVSVDLAEFSTLYQTPLSVPFVGYRSDGSIVVTEFITDGIIDGAGPLADFETFYFDSRFSDLVRLEIPGYGWTLDNMVFSSIPEPSTAALLLASALVLLTRKSRQ